MNARGGNLIHQTRLYGMRGVPLTFRKEADGMPLRNIRGYPGFSQKIGVKNAALRDARG